jgi:hypothetical protein
MAQLVQPCPGRLIALQAQDPLQPQCAGAVLLRRYPPNGADTATLLEVLVVTKMGPLSEPGLADA